MTDVREQNRAALDAVRIRRDALFDSILDLEGTLGARASDRVTAWAAGVMICSSSFLPAAPPTVFRKSSIAFTR